MSADNKIPDIIQASLENIKSMVDANTVIGKPITTPSGTTILPVSKVSVGIATGGIDFNSKKETKDNEKNFGGGGGTGLSVQPVGFLVISPTGSVDMINVDMEHETGILTQIAGFIERSPEIFEKLKAYFMSKAGEEGETEEE